MFGGDDGTTIVAAPIAVQEVRHAPLPPAYTHAWEDVQAWLEQKPGAGRQILITALALALGAVSGQLYQDTATRYFEKLAAENKDFQGLFPVPPALGAWSAMLINGILTGAIGLEIVLPRTLDAFYPERFKREHARLFAEPAPLAMRIGRGGVYLVKAGVALGSGVPLANLEKDTVLWFVQIVIQGGIFQGWAIIDLFDRADRLLGGVSRPFERWATGKTLEEQALDRRLQQVADRLSGVFARAKNTIVLYEPAEVSALARQLQIEFQHAQLNLGLTPEQVFRVATTLLQHDEADAGTSWHYTGLLMALLAPLGIGGYTALTWQQLSGSTGGRLAQLAFFAGPFNYLVSSVVYDKINGALNALTSTVTGRYHSSATQLLGKAFVLFCIPVAVLYGMGFLSSASALILLETQLRPWLVGIFRNTALEGVMRFTQGYTVFLAALFNCSPVTGVLAAGLLYLYQSRCRGESSDRVFATLSRLLDAYQDKASQLRPDMWIEALLVMPDETLRRAMLLAAVKNEPALQAMLLEPVQGGAALAALLQEGNLAQPLAPAQAVPFTADGASAVDERTLVHQLLPRHPACATAIATQLRAFDEHNAQHFCGMLSGGLDVHVLLSNDRTDIATCQRELPRLLKHEGALCKELMDKLTATKAKAEDVEAGHGTAWAQQRRDAINLLKLRGTQRYVQSAAAPLLEAGLAALAEQKRVLLGERAERTGVRLIEAETSAHTNGPTGDGPLEDAPPRAGWGSCWSECLGWARGYEPIKDGDADGIPDGEERLTL